MDLRWIFQTQDIVAREVRALEEAAKEHPRARRLILVLDRDGVGDVRNVPGVEVLPAYEWLLAELSQ
jgi:hypothetical protein